MVDVMLSFFFHFSFSSFCIVVASDSETAYNENLVFVDLFLLISHSFFFVCNLI